MICKCKRLFRALQLFENHPRFIRFTTDLGLLYVTILDEFMEVQLVQIMEPPSVAIYQ